MDYHTLYMYFLNLGLISYIQPILNITRLDGGVKHTVEIV